MFPRLNAQCTLWPCRKRRGEAVHWQHRSPACSDACGMQGLLSSGSFRLVGKGHCCYSALHLEEKPSPKVAFSSEGFLWPVHMDFMFGCFLAFCLPASLPFQICCWWHTQATARGFSVQRRNPFLFCQCMRLQVFPYASCSKCEISLRLRWHCDVWTKLIGFNSVQ